MIPWCLGIEERDWICFPDLGLFFYLASEACGIGGLDLPHLFGIDGVDGGQGSSERTVETRGHGFGAGRGNVGCRMR